MGDIVSLFPEITNVESLNFKIKIEKSKLKAYCNQRRKLVSSDRPTIDIDHKIFSLILGRKFMEFVQEAVENDIDFDTALSFIND